MKLQNQVIALYLGTGVGVGPRGVRRGILLGQESAETEVGGVVVRGIRLGLLVLRCGRGVVAVLLFFGRRV